MGFIVKSRRYIDAKIINRVKVIKFHRICRVRASNYTDYLCGKKRHVNVIIQNLNK